MSHVLPSLEMDALYSTLEEYQSRNSSSFPTLRSLQWFVKQNRRELLAAGALIEIAGRKRLHNEMFTTVAAQIGVRRSAARRGPFPAAEQNDDAPVAKAAASPEE